MLCRFRAVRIFASADLSRALLYRRRSNRSAALLYHRHANRPPASRCSRRSIASHQGTATAALCFSNPCPRCAQHPVPDLLSPVLLPGISHLCLAVALCHCPKLTFASAMQCQTIRCRHLSRHRAARLFIASSTPCVASLRRRKAVQIIAWLCRALAELVPCKAQLCPPQVCAYRCQAAASQVKSWPCPCHSYSLPDNASARPC